MEDFQKLVSQAKQGDTDAFARLYETVYQDMYRFALYTLKDPEDAKDVVSETVADAFAGIRRLRREEAFKGWIFKILSNKCRQVLSSYRKKTAELTEAALDEASRSLAAYAASQRMDEAESAVIRSMFFSLPAEERLIIALHLFGGYSSKEMARMLHMNENTLRSRQSRALKRLAEQMKD